jgi:2-polyprenyl-6-methoxyphenol hydroxylase-like FAD-dependent oxidoreductase
MDSLPEHAQVAVVGAGPVGLALATALTHYGVDAVVVDAAAGRSVHSKAAVVHSRTLEVLGEFGPVSDELVDRGVIVPYFAFRDHDRNLLTVDFRTLPTAYPYTLMVPQDVVETVLDKRLRDLGRAVHRSWRVDGLRRDDGGVVLSLVGGERRRELRARYVVGADGVHSTVRDLLGTGFSGARYAEAFFLADVRMR